MSHPIEIVFIRHGQSEWNLQNRFTGWEDSPLSPAGMDEARAAGSILAERSMNFDCAYTSVLRRAIQTAWQVMGKLELEWLPVNKDWRLNERHYGALQGQNKQQVSAQYGPEMVKKWRRSFLMRPPPADEESLTRLKEDPRYQKLNHFPTAESLQDTQLRVVEWWNELLIPALRQGRRPLVCAHGNSLRALIKHLDSVGDEAIEELNIPTGIPFVYRLSRSLKPQGYEFLASDADLEAAMLNVRNQAG